MGRPKKQTLLDDDDQGDAGNLETFKVNTEYAKRFEHNKKREDLHRLKELEKSGQVGPGEDSEESPSEDEDEEGVLLSKTMDAKILETLAKIKKRDPSIYQPDVKFFSAEAEEEDGEEGQGGQEKAKKKVFLKDVMMHGLTEDGEDEEDDDRSRKTGKGGGAKTYVEEQEDLKRAFLEAAGTGEVEEHKEDEGLLKVRKKTEEEKRREWEEAEAAGKEGEEGDTVRRLEEYFGNDDELDENERFLKEYLARQGWLDKDKDRVPTYDEIVGEVDEDEEELERQDRFEAVYNFRYEEGGSGQVEGHSRLVEGSVRKKAEVRKKQREAKQSRQEMERAAKREELKRLKNLKKKEVSEKLARIREVAGAAEDDPGLANLNMEDLEEDFDPEEYDKKMRQAFGEGYYGAEDEGFEVEEEGEGEEKPDFDAEDEVLGLPKGWMEGTGGKGFVSVRLKQKAKSGAGEGAGLEGAGGEEGEDEGSAEEDEAEEEEGEEGEEEEGGGSGVQELGETRRKRRRRLTLREKMAFERSLEEYHKLDYEDLIGGLPTRFKYREVKPNSFGLSTGEILALGEKELNQFVSVKKLAPYRAEEWEVRGAQKKLLDEEKKRIASKKASAQGRGEKAKKSNKKKHGEGVKSGGKEMAGKREGSEYEVESRGKTVKRKGVEEEESNGGVGNGSRKEDKEAINIGGGKKRRKGNDGDAVVDWVEKREEGMKSGKGTERKDDGRATKEEDGVEKDGKRAKEKRVLKEGDEVEGKNKTSDVPLLWNVSTEGLSKAGKKNLWRKLKRMEVRGEKVDALSMARLQSYGEDALPPGQRKPKKTKVRQKKDVVD